jgi:hypothetical protein
VGKEATEEGGRTVGEGERVAGVGEELLSNGRERNGEIGSPEDESWEGSSVAA